MIWTLLERLQAWWRNRTMHSHFEVDAPERAGDYVIETDHWYAHHHRGGRRDHDHEREFDPLFEDPWPE